MSIVDKLYHSISKIWHPSWDQLAFVCKCLEYVEELSIFICWPAVKCASKYSDSENIFHVFVHLYLYKFSLAFISSWESKNVTLFIFWHFLMKMGLKKRQMTRDTYLKQKQWESVEICRSSWMNDYKDSYRFIPRHQICHS